MTAEHQQDDFAKRGASAKGWSKRRICKTPKTLVSPICRVGYSLEPNRLIGCLADKLIGWAAFWSIGW